MNETNRSNRNVRDVYVRDSDSGMSIALAAVLLIVFVVIILGGLYFLGTRGDGQQNESAGGSIEVNLPGGGNGNGGAGAQ